LDDATLFPVQYSALFAPPARTSLAVVLLHGFTNGPAQFVELAAELFARGHAVVVPRLPGHGSSGRSLAGIGATEWLATTREATDIACGLAERVVVAGVSLGGSLAAWTAAARSDVARGVAIVPFLGVINLGATGNTLLERALGALPDAEVPWDPFGDQALIPPYAYPGFPSRGLGQSLRLGRRLLSAAARAAPAAPDIVLVTNSHEPAIDNRMVDSLVARWNRRRRGSAWDFRFDDLPANHDIIDPLNPLQRHATVYPKLIEFFEDART
jgi:pimeloyl-ACP methyl ester carboxylesterase